VTADMQHSLREEQYRKIVARFLRDEADPEGIASHLLWLPEVRRKVEMIRREEAAAKRRQRCLSLQKPSVENKGRKSLYSHAVTFSAEAGV